MRNFVLVVLLLAGTTCHAGIGKWLKNDVAPILKGKKPLKIDPNRVSIVHKGKPILKYEGDSLYVKAAGVTFQTSKLRQRMAEAGAIYAGDYTVMSKVAAEQFNKEIAKAQKEGEIALVEDPGSQDVPKADVKGEDCKGKDLTIHNQTPVALRYALNGDAFELASGDGSTHCAEDRKFYLQFDNDTGEKFNVARFALTGNSYRLFLGAATSDKIEIAKIN